MLRPKRLFAPALALLLVLCTAWPLWAGHVPGELLVRFRAGTPTATAAARHRAMGATVAAALPSTGIQRVKLPEGLGVEEAVRRYRGLPEVEVAQPNYVYHASTTPNDPYYPPRPGQQFPLGQWHLPKIGAPTAWNTITDASAIIVATIDTGVDYNHPDIIANLWPGIGHNFINYTTARSDGGSRGSLAANDPFDDDTETPSHGSHVAGIIGAVGNNGIGVSGVCWRVKIMACKALDNIGEGYDDEIIAAIRWAADHGAKIINISVESDPGQAEDTLLAQAIDYARQTTGALVVCAAGNTGINVDSNPIWPGSLPNDNVINVANSNRADSMTYNTANGVAYLGNYGPASVDLAAPGEDILSLKAGNDYQYMSGTSMAAPVVAGAAALLLARHPAFDYRQLKGYLVRYCDNLGFPVLSGGRLNVASSLAAADSGLAWDVPTTPAAATPTGSDSKGGGGGCFIATAAYGSPLAGEVRLLSLFRDRFLLGNPLGRPIVAAYYSLSPPAARYIAQRAWLRPMVRATLRPVLPLAGAAMDDPLLLALLGTLGLVAALGGIRGRLTARRLPPN